MLTTGPNLGLLAHGAPGEPHYDELLRFFRGIDALVFLSVKRADLSTPPASPADGDRFIVAAAPTGAWAGHAGKVARYSAAISSWEFYTAHPGWIAYVEHTDAYIKHTASGAWELHRGPAVEWGTPAGTVSRATFDTASATATDIAQRLAALVSDLKQAGVIK